MRVALEHRGPRRHPGPKLRLREATHHLRARLVVGRRVRDLASGPYHLLPEDEANFLATCKGRLISLGFDPLLVAAFVMQIEELLVPHRLRPAPPPTWAARTHGPDSAFL